MGGARMFYATYTAYTGRSIRSELIDTRGFVRFNMTALSGEAARNKGMALEWRRPYSEAAVPLGVRADRQLRLADRARRGLVAADSRYRAYPPVFDRRSSAR